MERHDGGCRACWSASSRHLRLAGGRGPGHPHVPDPRGAEFYGGAATFLDSAPIDLGEEGVIQVRPGDLGVDVQWIQDGLVLTIFADTLGLADTSTFEDDIRALAAMVSDRLR